MTSSNAKFLVSKLLDAAMLIGKEICESAYWHQDAQRCNWVGRSMNEMSRLGAQLTPTVSALGSDFYNGTSGIALFLARLYQHAPEEIFKKTALGAIEHAITASENSKNSHANPLAFYGGDLGVAYVADRVGEILDCKELQTRAEALLDRAIQNKKDQPLDLIAGHVGAILALLEFYRLKNDTRRLEQAVELGDELCQKAEKRGLVWSWPQHLATGPGLSSRPLTGLAHGASGFALALMELYAASNEAEFLAASRSVFAYEDSLFDEAQGNWPDLRDFGQPANGNTPHRCTVAWCHGASGIALARLRAAELDSELFEKHMNAARVAVNTTKQALQRNILNRFQDATLCHGQSGLAEIVFEYGLFTESTTDIALVKQSALELITLHAAEGKWPSGTPSRGPNPSLLVGTAGIGHFLLRIIDPVKVPSVLGYRHNYAVEKIKAIL